MMADTSQPVVIIGAGRAASELATTLRKDGYAGPISIIGEESHPPYQRPPLSKGYLAGELSLESLFLKSAMFFRNAGVDLILDMRVNSIDRTAKTVTLADGRQLSYGKLVLATGGRPRKLTLLDQPVIRAPNLHYLRTIEDVDSMREQFKVGRKLVIIGGGYIGLEVAAVARHKEIDVTVLEAAPRVLARVTAPEVSDFYQRTHCTAGVNIITNSRISGFEFDDADHITATLLGDGNKIPTDILVVGIGLIPNVELAEAAGLTIDNGIAVDEYCRTSDNDILAIGDCSNQFNTHAGHKLRLESVPSALEQARSAAALLMGRYRSCDTVPWFWSDQYNLKLQMAGVSQGYDLVALRGSPEHCNFLYFYLKDGALLAVDSVGRPQDFMVAKMLIAKRAKVDPALLADESIPLKSLMTAG